MEDPLATRTVEEQRYRKEAYSEARLSRGNAGKAIYPPPSSHLYDSPHGIVKGEEGRALLDAHR